MTTELKSWDKENDGMTGSRYFEKAALVQCAFFWGGGSDAVAVLSPFRIAQRTGQHWLSSISTCNAQRGTAGLSCIGDGAEKWQGCIKAMAVGEGLEQWSRQAGAYKPATDV